MSDTDTDDTDLLLLIPPNYYTDTAERLLREVKMSAFAAQDALSMPPPPAPTSAAYQFLHPSKKSELNQINTRLQNVGLDVEDDRHFDALSDISTISTNTVRTASAEVKQPRELHGMVHSTPKGGSVEPPRQRHLDDNILVEIDHYLDDKNGANRWRPDFLHHHSENHLRNDRIPQEGHTATNSLPSSSSCGLAAEPVRCTRNSLNTDHKLISLSELWGKSSSEAGTLNDHRTPNRVPCSPSLKEEQLRRQHLEKTVHSLQSQLLEYQQRISVAIDVDRSKDAALNEAEKLAKSLSYEVQQLRDSHQQLEAARGEYHSKIDTLQHELAQAVNLATKFQEKNEKLEGELDHLRQDAKEWEHRVEEMEAQLHGSRRSEELSHAELNKLRDRFAKADYQQEKVTASKDFTAKSLILLFVCFQLKARIEELERERNTLSNQKEMLQEYHQKQKSRADSLESQRKSLQETLANLTETEVRKRNPAGIVGK